MWEIRRKIEVAFMIMWGKKKAKDHDYKIVKWNDEFAVGRVQQNGTDFM